MGGKVEQTQLPQSRGDNPLSDFSQNVRHVLYCLEVRCVSMRAPYAAAGVSDVIAQYVLTRFTGEKILAL